MNCLNCERYVREAIDSVYAQTYDNWEIVFWDNASTDRSSVVAGRYDTRLKYFRGEKTAPLYAARNMALKEASGKLIAFLDTDDLWMPYKLEQQVRVFDEDNKVGLVHGNAIVSRKESTRLYHRRNYPTGYVFRRVLKHYHINLQTTMISRKALNSMTCWFDESMDISGDAELFLRICHSWKSVYLPQVLAKYREHGASLGATQIEKIFAETDKLILNLTQCIPGFANDFKFEIEKFRKRTLLSIIVSKWKYGGGSEVRKEIYSKRLPLALVPSMVFCALSLLPIHVYEDILKFLQDNPLEIKRSART